MPTDDLLKDDEFVVIARRVQHDHFSGGLRVKVQTVSGVLADARCRLGRYLQVTPLHRRPRLAFRGMHACCETFPRA